MKKIFESERRLHAGNHSVELLAQDFEKNYNMYIYPVHWQFAQLDQHPSDRCVSFFSRCSSTVSRNWNIRPSVYLSTGVTDPIASPLTSDPTEPVSVPHLQYNPAPSVLPSRPSAGVSSISAWPCSRCPPFYTGRDGGGESKWHSGVSRLYLRPF